MIKGRAIRKVMGGGGGPFPTCTITFSKFFACVDYFFFIIPAFSGLKIFSEHKKKGSKNFSGLTSV